MTVIEIVPGPAEEPSVPWTRWERLLVRAYVVSAAFSSAGFISWFESRGVDIYRWATPLLVVVTFVGLSWRPGRKT